MLFDGSLGDTCTVWGPVRYNAIQQGQASNFKFNAGVTVGSSKFNFKQLAGLARTARTKTTGQYKVIVVTKGGTYNMYNFRPNGASKDQGKTLVIFNTPDAVILTKTPDGKAFGPSVLAPFSLVTLAPDAGFIDGCLIAKQFIGSGAGATKLQMHGNCYRGPIICSPAKPPPPAAATPGTGAAKATGKGKSKGSKAAWVKGLWVGFISLIGAGIIGGGVAVAIKKKQFFAPVAQIFKPPLPLCAQAGPVVPGVTPTGPPSKSPCWVQIAAVNGTNGTNGTKKMLRRWDADGAMQLEQPGGDEQSDTFSRGQAFAATWFVPLLACALLASVVCGLAGLSKARKAWRRRQISTDNVDVALE